ncbi:protein-arginine deiminase type-1-like [Rhinophrynus dorsalis]
MLRGSVTVEGKAAEERHTPGIMAVEGKAAEEQHAPGISDGGGKAAEERHAPGISDGGGKSSGRTARCGDQWRWREKQRKNGTLQGSVTVEGKAAEERHAPGISDGGGKSSGRTARCGDQWRWREKQRKNGTLRGSVAVEGKAAEERHAPGISGGGGKSSGRTARCGDQWRWREKQRKNGTLWGSVAVEGKAVEERHTPGISGGGGKSSGRTARSRDQWRWREKQWKSGTLWGSVAVEGKAAVEQHTVGISGGGGKSSGRAARCGDQWRWREKQRKNSTLWGSVAVEGKAAVEQHTVGISGGGGKSSGRAARSGDQWRWREKQWKSGTLWGSVEVEGKAAEEWHADLWTWGPNGKGAILLVNCDREKDGSRGLDSESVDLPNSADLKDMSPMILTAEGPDEIFDKYQVILHISASDATKLRVYCKGRYQYQQVLGGGKLSYDVQRGNNDEIFFSVEGLDFPDVDFSGLVYINLTFQKTPEKTEIFTEKVVFRLAPWIMTPNTQKPLEVYVCSVAGNQKFLRQLKVLVNKVRCNLNICTEVDNRQDRWIQDEMEFGYTEAPHKQFPVVFDSPRNKGLRDFPFKRILGPDFGYVTRDPKIQKISGLDFFGNLEVSPPVKVDGKDYPLGRILYGCGLPKSGIKMNKVIRKFLKAQQVQAPMQLYSDWLTVGHVDEFMCFVPAPGKKGFRLLLASPCACLALFKEKQQEGHGTAVMFEGLNTKQMSIDEVLEEESFETASKYTQECINMNRKLMMNKLGLGEEDIIDIPVLYTLNSNKADAFFPNMVNMLVLGKFLGIPKPFGPIINGRCCLEEKVCSLLEPLGLSCVFIDDFAPYHQMKGDVHCGTNVLRNPFSMKWWECIP